MRDTALFDQPLADRVASEQQSERDTPTMPLATARFPGVHFSVVEAAVIRLFDRIGCFEEQVGFSEIQPIRFASHSWAAERDDEIDEE